MVKERAGQLDLLVRLEHVQQRQTQRTPATDHHCRRRRRQAHRVPPTLGNLHLTILGKAGVEQKSFGDSTGTIAGV